MKHLKRFKLCCKIDYWITEAMCFMFPYIVMPLCIAVLVSTFVVHDFIRSKLIIIAVYVLASLIAISAIAAIICGILNYTGNICMKLYKKSLEKEKIY